MKDGHADRPTRQRRHLVGKDKLVPSPASSSSAPTETAASDRAPADDEETTEIEPVPEGHRQAEADEQDTDLTGRPGTPSALRRRLQGRGRAQQRSLLGPEAYGVGTGIRPASILAEDRPTEVGDEPPELIDAPPLPPELEPTERGPSPTLPPPPDRGDEPQDTAPSRLPPPPDPSDAEVLAAAGDLPAWDPDAVTQRGDPPPAPPPGLSAADTIRPPVDPDDDTLIRRDPPERTDPFGVDLPTDEVDLLAAAGGSLPEWDAPDSLFERDTQPLPGRAWSTEDSATVAAALVVLGVLLVVLLSITAWLAL